MADVLTNERAIEQIDPVCGMTVEPSQAAGSFEYQGRTYYFCSLSCLERFRATPGNFVTGAGESKSPALPADGGARSYVCPMDPEVREREPGACPKCGMALEPDLSDRAAFI